MERLREGMPCQLRRQRRGTVLRTALGGLLLLGLRAATSSFAVASVPTTPRRPVGPPPVTAPERQDVPFEVLTPPRSSALASASLPRRRDLLQLGSVGLVAGSAEISAAKEVKKFQTAWTANDGVQFLTYFNEENYGAMRDDTRRTPQFIKAIQQRVSNRAIDQRVTVLDIGTGPFALFALAAARAGAKKVYAVEANPEAAERAKQAVAEADDVPDGVVEVIEGFTTAITLPEKVDIVVAEIVGAFSSEENMISTIQDTKERHMKNPTDANNFIPCRVQTLGAPVSYALHPVLAPPRYERLKGQPLRVNCRDETVQLLSDPQIIEDVNFGSELPSAGKWGHDLKFEISTDRLEANEKFYYKALIKEEVEQKEAQDLARSTARSFSGMGFWPKLILDPAGEIVVDSRGKNGEHQKSHWPTVLSLMSPLQVPITPGQQLQLKEVADFERDVLGPVKYTLDMEISG